MLYDVPPHFRGFLDATRSWYWWASNVRYGGPFPYCMFGYVIDSDRTKAGKIGYLFLYKRSTSTTEKKAHN